MSTSISCPFLNNSQCELVTELVGKPCKVEDNTCKACLSTDRPSRINLVTIALAQKLTPTPRSTSERKTASSPTSEQNILAIDLTDPNIMNQLGDGFGSRLHALISPFLSEVEGCKCHGHRDILDLWTPEYIQKNIDRVVQWLAYEARKRSIPFSYIATRLVLLALLRFK